MAFKITKKPTFSAQVEVYTPNDKRGHDYSTFDAVFNRTSTDELDELRKLPQKDVMRRKLVGWEGFNDDQNQPVEYNQENLEILISVPEALHGLTLAYWNSLVKAREKN
ncbi:MAG: phage tail assembly chaperone [Nitrosomonas sp.]|uniref:phage tail assembly chaperone n=1 Tax=Nitrosomonas sp. TaxID=42353 RepID=UPI0025E601D7|nr:phage tail assembly chaperone [Nitrosomonas sp.]MBY0474218.1 phage tail assembly chaperone [Nitrosomonas sp.]